MAGVSIGSFGASFIKYLPGVVQTLNNTTYVRTLPKGKMKWEGDHLEWHIHTQRNKAVSYIEDGGAFPTPGQQSYVKATAYRKFVAGSVQLTDGILKNAATTKNAAISVVDSELTGMMDGIKKFSNFFWTRDGTGVVALLGQDLGGGNTVITVDDARGMWDGKEYEIRDATTPTTIHTNSITVSSVARALTANDEASVTLTASEADGSKAAGDFIVWGTGNQSAYNRAITGLDALIDDAATTFQNVNTTTYPRYTSPVLDNSGTDRALTPALFRQMLAMIRQESGDAPPDGMDVITSVWGSINVEEMYESDLRLRSDDTVAGVAIASFQSTLGRVNVINDPDTPYGKMFFMAPQEITYAVQAELDWRRDEPGGPIFKRNDQSAVYTATALEACELVLTGQRNKCGKIEDLAETKTTAY